MRDGMRFVRDRYHRLFRDHLVAAPLKLFLRWYRSVELNHLRDHLIAAPLNAALEPVLETGLRRATQ
jgi:hypothetical protein